MWIWDLLFLLWFLILPVLGLLAIIFGPIIWFLIVPKISRRLAWDRFRNVSYHMVANDGGTVSLLTTKEKLPEGVERTNKGWRFIPRPAFMKGRKGGKGPTTSEIRHAENMIRAKYIWEDMGKPIHWGYAGQIASVNPITLAGLQFKDERSPLVDFVQDIITRVKKLPDNHKEEILPRLEKVVEGLKFKAYKVLDATILKALDKMITPSQVKALALNREMRGMKRAGKQYVPLMVFAVIVIALLILGGLLITRAP